MQQRDRIKDPSIIVSNKVYDFLKAFVMIVAPSSTVIYLGLTMAFDLPYTFGILITTNTITLILGIFLVFTSTTQHETDAHFDGNMLVTEEENGDLLYNFEIHEDINLMRLRSRVSFRVINAVPEITNDTTRNVG